MSRFQYDYGYIYNDSNVWAPSSPPSQMTLIAVPVGDVAFDHIYVYNADNIDHTFTLFLGYTAIVNFLATATVPAGSGTDGVHPAVDLVPLFVPGALNLQFEASYLASLQLNEATTSHGGIAVYAFGGGY